MYNEERKMEYTNEMIIRNDNLVQVTNALFRFTSRMERKLNKDVCDFSIEEIIGLHRSSMTYSANFVFNRNSQLSLYTEWCLQKGYVRDRQNHYQELNKELFLRCVNKGMAEQLLITRTELMNLLRNDIYNPGDKFLLLGIFEGIGGKNLNEFKGLKTSSFEGNIIHLPGRDLEVSKELIEIGRESEETYDKIPYSYPKGRFERIKYSPTDDNIIKALANIRSDTDYAEYRRLANIVKNCRAVTECQALRIKNLRDSGLADMIINYAKQEKVKDWKAVCVNHKKELVARYGEFRVNEFENQYGTLMKQMLNSEV